MLLPANCIYTPFYYWLRNTGIQIWRLFYYQLLLPIREHNHFYTHYITTNIYYENQTKLRLVLVHHF